MAAPLGKRGLHEPAVTLSDLAIAIETGAFAIGVARLGREHPDTVRSRALRRWLIGFYTSAAAASLAGAAVHGLSASKDDPGRLAYWRVSLSAISLAGLCAWHLAATLEPRSGVGRSLLVPVDIVYLAYLVTVSRTHPSFQSALALYAPGAFFLRLALLSRLRVPAERRSAALAQAALAVSTVAAVIQLRKIALHPRWFDHNATFHLVQAAAFAILYPAARGMLRSASSSPASPAANRSRH